MARTNRKQQPQPTNEVEVDETIKSSDEVGLDEETPNEPVVLEVPEVTQVEAEAVQTPEYLIAKYGNKSKAIRALNAEGKTRSEIAKLLGIRYQHVNNVLGQVLKREIKAERDAKNGVTQ